MSDIISDAADSIVPLLSMGAGAAARDVAERGGVQLSEAVSGILARLRARLRGETPARTNVEAALRSAIADSQLSRDDLKLLISVGQHAGGIHVEGDVCAKNAIIGSTVHIDGDFNA
ncbi:MAG: hypothetical protein ACHQCH_04790 [Solirubrobacterales bacterium]